MKTIKRKLDSNGIIEALPDICLFELKRLEKYIQKEIDSREEQ